MAGILRACPVSGSRIRRGTASRFQSGAKTFQETPETETENEEEQPPAVRIEWRLPDDFELAKDFPPQDEEPDEEGTYLMFSFYSDGGAAGQRRLELRLGELVRIFEISTLTGRLIEIPEEKK